jgi:hypothetical protein
LNELRDVEAQLVPLDSLKAYDGNAKQHDSDNIDAIANSISEFGFRNPILAWHNEDGVPEIVAGHGRAAAAKRLRMEQVPVIFVDDLTDAQRRMLTLADNQTTLMTGWDKATLDAELDALETVFNVEDFGFELPEIEEDIQPEIPFNTALDTKRDYIVLQFSTQEDYDGASQLLGVERGDELLPGKQARYGKGRVLDGVKALGKLVDDEED